MVHVIKCRLKLCQTEGWDFSVIMLKKVVMMVPQKICTFGFAKLIVNMAFALRKIS